MSTKIAENQAWLHYVMLVICSVICVAVFGVIAACTTHILGDADIASLQDSQQLEARIYKDLDGGRDRAFARDFFSRFTTSLVPTTLEAVNATASEARSAWTKVTQSSNQSRSLSFLASPRSFKICSISKWCGI